MSAHQTSELSKQTHDELCCTYAALILHDEGIEITPQQLKKVIDASGNKVDAFWPSLFSKALAGIDIKAFMSGSSAPAAPAAGSSSAAAPETKKEEKAAKEQPKKEEPKEAEEDMDMGDLFAF